MVIKTKLHSATEKNSENVDDKNLKGLAAAKTIRIG